MQIIKRQLNMLVKSDAKTRATVDGHSKAIGWMYGIMGAIILFVVAVALGVK
jgi:hypothetical protein